jgi:hypothetical protein
MTFAPLVLTITLITSSAWAAATASDLTHAPEPGTERTFTSQAGLDWYREQQRITDTLAAEHALARLHLLQDDAQHGEPIDAADPYASISAEELEDIAALLADPRTLDLLGSSHYFRAVIEGRSPTAN